MSRVPLPLSNDWKTWGRQLARQLSIALDNLRWKTDEDVPSQNGSVLWDETLKDAVVSVDGEWRPLSMDFNVYLAEQEIFNTYGDRVSVVEKKKTLTKFGRTDNADANVWTTVWETASDQPNETYVTTNAIDTISSTNSGDTNVINIEGHTVSGTGSSSEFTFVTQSATLNGQNKVTLTTPLARVSRAYVDNGGSVAGDILVYEDTAISGGKPTDTTKIHISLKGSLGHTQTFKAATTLSNVDYGILTGGYVSVSKKSSASVDFQLEIRMPGGVFRPSGGRITLDTNATTTEQIFFKPFGIMPKNSDIRIVVNSDTANTEVDATIQMYLAKVVT
jgi:hypothetical protein